MRLAAILFAALVLQIVVVTIDLLPPGRPLLGDELLYSDAADVVAEGRIPPSDLWPPLGPGLLGALRVAFGPGLLPVASVQLAELIGAALLLRAFLLRAGLSRIAADVGAAFLLLDPQVARFVTCLWPEVPHLFLLLLALSVLLPTSAASWRRSFLGGACLGAAVLVKSLVVPFLPVLLLIPAAGVSGPARARLSRLLPALAGLALVVVPFSAIQRARHGTFSISPSGPVNVWIGLRDPKARDDVDSVAHASVSAFRSDPRPVSERNRDLRRASADLVRRDGIGTVLRRQLARQYGRLLDHRSFFVDLLPGGRLRPGIPPAPFDGALRLYGALAWGVLLALASFGLFQIRGAADARRFALPLLFLAYGAALFLVVHTKTRFRIGFLPALICLAALAVDRLGRRGEPRGALRLAAGALMAAGALALAFDLP